MRIGIAVVGLVACLSVMGRPGTVSAAPDRCSGRKLAAAASLADRLLRAEAAAVRTGEVPDAARVARAQDRYARQIARLDARGGCGASTDGPTLQAEVERLVAETVAILRPASLAPDERACASHAIRSVGRSAKGVMSARGRETIGGGSPPTAQAERTGELFAHDMARARALGGCIDARQEQELQELLDSVAEFAVREVERIAAQTHAAEGDASSERAARNVSSDETSRETLAGLSGIAAGTLDDGAIVTWRRQGSNVPPRAVLLLIPGAPAGASGFRALAADLVMRADAMSFALEVWSLARSGPTPGQVDAGVESARARARATQVFLGGLGEGASFACRYAAVDFADSGTGGSKMGYAKLRGLALLEGGGGSLPSIAGALGGAPWERYGQTAAKRIDIPVIAFRATGQPATAFLPLARSIGVCTADTCDGTPRFFEPASAPPATVFGGAAGGFEVRVGSGKGSSLHEALLAFMKRNTPSNPKVGESMESPTSAPAPR